MNEKYEFSEEWTEEELKDWEEKMSEPIHFKKLTAEDVKKLKSQRQNQIETPQKLMPAEKENPWLIQYSPLIVEVKEVKNEKYEKDKRQRFIGILEKLKQDEEKMRTAEEELSEPIHFTMLTIENMKPLRKKLVNIPAYKLKSGK